MDWEHVAGRSDKTTPYFSPWRSIIAHLNRPKSQAPKERTLRSKEVDELKNQVQALEESRNAERNMHQEKEGKLRIQVQISEDSRILWKCLSITLAMVFVFMLVYYCFGTESAQEWKEAHYIVQKERDNMKAKMEKASIEIAELKQEQEECYKNFEETHRIVEKERGDLEKAFNATSELKLEREECYKNFEKVRRVTEKERDGMKAKMQKVVIELKQEQEVVGWWRVAFFLLFLSVGCLVAIAMNIYCWKKNCCIAEKDDMKAGDEMDITELKEVIYRILNKKCDDVKAMADELLKDICELKRNEFSREYKAGFCCVQNVPADWGRNCNNCQKGALTESWKTKKGKNEELD